MQDGNDAMTGPSRRAALRALSGAAAAVAGVAMPYVARGANLIPVRMMDTPGRYASVETMYVAQAKRFLRAEGLELDLVSLQQQASWGFNSGLVDFTASADYIYIVNIVDKGLRTRQIVSSVPDLDPRRANDGLFVLEDSPIDGPADNAQGSERDARESSGRRRPPSARELRAQAGRADVIARLMLLPDLRSR